VRVVRVGAIDVLLVVVADPIPIGVRRVGVGAHDVLGGVGHTVPIGVRGVTVVRRVEGVGQAPHLFAVGDPTAVGVGVQRIREQQDLGAVPQPVVVAVAVGGIGAEQRFDHVGQEVVVRVDGIE